MNFNKKEFQEFRRDLKEAMKTVEEKHGVAIECGNISYSDYEFKLGLTVLKNDSRIDGKKAVFEQNCILYGFKPSDYNREFTADRKWFKLVGFNAKSPKNNCNIYCIDDGKTYRCNDGIVKRAFAIITVEDSSID